MNCQLVCSYIAKCIIILSAVLLLSCSTSELDYCARCKGHPCGDPCTVSTYYFSYSAELAMILDCSHIEVEVHDLLLLDPASNKIVADIAPSSKILRVKLAGISPDIANDPKGINCAKELTKLPPGTSIELLSRDGIFINKSSDDSEEIPIRALLNSGTDIGRTLLKRGLAVNASSEGLDWWIACDYKLV